MTISLSFSRTSLSLEPLVVTGSPSGSLFIPGDGLTWPSFETRRTYAPDSAYASGRTLLAAVRGAGDMPVTIYARGTTTTELETAKAVLAAAVAQWSYTLTLTVDSVAHAFNAEVVLDLPWGPVDEGMVSAHMARTSFSIPVNP